MRRRAAGALLATAALAVMAWPGAARARDQAGEPPPTATVAGRPLRLIGAAVQTKLWFHIYTVALYLEARPDSAEQVLTSERPRALRLTLHRSAGRAQVAGALRDGMLRQGVDVVRLKPQLDRLMAAIPDMQAGESLEIHYVPGKGTLLRDERGRSMFIDGKDFADALFRVWLGGAPEMARIRRGLLGDRAATAAPAPAAAAKPTPRPTTPITPTAATVHGRAPAPSRP